MLGCYIQSERPPGHPPHRRVRHGRPHRRHRFRLGTSRPRDELRHDLRGARLRGLLYGYEIARSLTRHPHPSLLITLTPFALLTPHTLRPSPSRFALHPHRSPFAPSPYFTPHPQPSLSSSPLILTPHLSPSPLTLTLSLTLTLTLSLTLTSHLSTLTLTLTHTHTLVLTLSLTLSLSLSLYIYIYI